MNFIWLIAFCFEMVPAAASFGRDDHFGNKHFAGEDGLDYFGRKAPKRRDRAPHVASPPASDFFRDRNVLPGFDSPTFGRFGDESTLSRNVASPTNWALIISMIVIGAIVVIGAGVGAYFLWCKIRTVTTVVEVTAEPVTYQPI